MGEKLHDVSERVLELGALTPLEAATLFIRRSPVPITINDIASCVKQFDVDSHFVYSGGADLEKRLFRSRVVRVCSGWLRCEQPRWYTAPRVLTVPCVFPCTKQCERVRDIVAQVEAGHVSPSVLSRPAPPTMLSVLPIMDYLCGHPQAISVKSRS